MHRIRIGMAGAAKLRHSKIVTTSDRMFMETEHETGLKIGTVIADRPSPRGENNFGMQALIMVVVRRFVS